MVSTFYLLNSHSLVISVKETKSICCLPSSGKKYTFWKQIKNQIWLKLKLPVYINSTQDTVPSSWYRAKEINGQQCHMQLLPRRQTFSTFISFLLSASLCRHHSAQPSIWWGGTSVMTENMS